MKRCNYLFSQLIILIVFCLSSNSLSFAETRVALIIGNSQYASAPLKNPVNDAQDMGNTLATLGFDVDVYQDLNRKQMRSAIRKFGEKLKKSDVGLFFYAGHGIQIKGKNYLIPIATDVSSADEVEDESIDANSILRKMETAANPVNIVILDACRNNPFARSFRSSAQGLARMEGPVGSLIAYATAPGSVASDGTGRNGLYTQHLLNTLQAPNLNIEQVFKTVRKNVIKETGGKQIPWESSSLTGDFVFSLSDKAPSPPPVNRNHLQIISNISGAKVSLNSIPRGVTNQQGVLNLSNLNDSEVHLEIKAKGYKTEQKKVKLIAGQWQKVTIPLKKTIAEKKTPAPERVRDSQETHQKLCLKPGKMVLLSRVAFSDHKGNIKKKTISPYLFSRFKNLLAEQSFTLTNGGEASKPVKLKLLKKAEVSWFQKLTGKQSTHYLLAIDIRVKAHPIKLYKTQMKTIQGEITMELTSLKSGESLAMTAKSFKTAGIIIDEVFKQQVEIKLKAMLEDLLTNACKSH